MCQTRAQVFHLGVKKPLTLPCLLCIIQTTKRRQTPTMRVSATFFCSVAPSLMLVPMWRGREEAAATQACLLEWRSGMDCCGSSLWRSLMKESTTANEGKAIHGYIFILWLKCSCTPTFFTKCLNSHFNHCSK